MNISDTDVTTMAAVASVELIDTISNTRMIPMNFNDPVAIGILVADEVVNTAFNLA